MMKSDKRNKETKVSSRKPQKEEQHICGNTSSKNLNDDRPSKQQAFEDAELGQT